MTDANHQQQHQKQQRILDELAVAKSELTSGDVSGLVYVQSSPGAAFLVVSRSEALRGVERKIEELSKIQDKG
ncbi:hypothetical protein ACHAXA_009951 [Cyclostephanos tholiformis]|uniref:Uncharacterized protein n=1 Tax=Cyclostephanos tholiformis TaxID=382380 RepID=A0ABD3RY55_9STRA